MEQVEMKVRGIVSYSKFEDDLYCMKLLVDDKTIEEVENNIVDLDGQLSVCEKEFDGTDYQGFNIKSGYDFPIYNVLGKDMRTDEEKYPIYYGAEVIVKVKFKETSFKKKRFVSGYVQGVCVIKQGEKTVGCSFDDFKDMLNEEDCEF